VIEYDKLLTLLKLDEFVDDELTSQPSLIKNEEDLELVLRYLRANDKCILNEHLIENRKLVKFSCGFNQRCDSITQLEVCYVKLRNLEAKLESEVENLSKQIEVLVENQIKVYVRQNNKQMALKYLKKKKQLEKSIEKKEATLTNIQTMIHNIQQTDTNKITFEVYNESASALKEANKGLDLNKIDDTIEQLQDVFDTNAEIEDALKSPISSKYAFDDKELNHELDILLADVDVSTSDLRKGLKFDNDTFNLSEMLESLPSVPKTDTKVNSRTAETS
jgi:hypothetical protein